MPGKKKATRKRAQEVTEPQPFALTEWDKRLHKMLTANRKVRAYQHGLAAKRINENETRAHKRGLREAAKRLGGGRPETWDLTLFETAVVANRCRVVDVAASTLHVVSRRERNTGVPQLLKGICGEAPESLEFQGFVEFCLRKYAEMGIVDRTQRRDGSYTYSYWTLEHFEEEREHERARMKERVKEANVEVFEQYAGEQLQAAGIPGINLENRYRSAIELDEHDTVTVLMNKLGLDPRPPEVQLLDFLLCMPRRKG